MANCRILAGVLLAATSFTSASAAVLINPLPPIRPGISVEIERFTTVPATSSARARTGIQGMKALNDGSQRLFVNDTRGVLYVTTTSGATPRPYLDLRTQGVGFSNAASSTQTGLMSFAFHPNFNKDPAKPGYNVLYTVDTTAAAGNSPGWSIGTGPVSHHDVVREWTVKDPAAATATILSKREVLRVAQPYSDHGPGTIAFNPNAAAGSSDYGKLYIALGDGGNPNDPHNSAQSLTSPFGKILRIDPADPAGPASYSIPAYNPFVADAEARGEIWAYGLRNPQQFSWDSTGKMYIGDIGQAQIEEVNVGVAGANYGWPKREFTYARGDSKSDLNSYDMPANTGAFADPLAQYDHEEIARDGISALAGIGGAFRYEGSRVPGLFGQVLISDLVSGRLFYFDPIVTPGSTASLRELSLILEGASTTFRALEGYSSSQRVDLRLGVDQEGEIYFLTKGDGDIYRFVATSVPEPDTWALLISGFGLIGATLRHKRRPKAVRRNSTGVL